MVSLSEWAQNSPVLAAALIVAFFLMIFGVSVLMILMLGNHHKKPELLLKQEDTEPFYLDDNQIIYAGAVQKFTPNVKNFCIALGAPYAVANEQPVDTIDTEASALIHAWKIFSKVTLLNQLERIRTFGSRRIDEMMIASILDKEHDEALRFIASMPTSDDKRVLTEIYHNRSAFENAPVLAWDVIRAIMLIRSAVHTKARFLKEDEAVDYMYQMAEPLYRKGYGWKDISKGFLAGRRIWRIRSHKKRDGMMQVVDRLLTHENSPWLLQPRPEQWPCKPIETLLFSPQEFDTILNEYFIKNGKVADDLGQAFIHLSQKASMEDLCRFMNSFRYGLNYLAAGPLREVGYNLGLSSDNVRALAAGVMLGGMKILSALESDIDTAMAAIADDVFVVQDGYILPHQHYLELDRAIQNMAIQIYDRADKEEKSLFGLTITIEDLKEARNFGQNSYPEEFDWQYLPQFGHWVEAKLSEMETI